MIATVPPPATGRPPEAPPGRYRPDVDGLRAVAVLAVILNHLHPALLPGGFLGVDVFFVISGYVITLSLSGRPASTGRSFLLAFYGRRCRRLMPALVACVLLTALAAQPFLAPSSADTTAALQTGIAALFGVSNLLLLAQASDYFGASAQINPFTHTWSLGVEEQFYLVYPLLLLAVGSVRHPGPRAAARLRRLLLAIALPSLLAFLLLQPSHPDAAYYLLPTRAWELASGALLWLAVERRGGRSPLPAALPPALPFGLLLASLALPPGWQAIGTPLAVLATVLLIGRLADPQVAAAGLGRRLGGRLAVAIGRRSYSLYLWHWPVLVLARWTLGVRPATVPLLLGLMLLLAELSFRWVEQPLRRRLGAGPRRRPLLAAAAGSSCAALVLHGFSGPLRGRLYSGEEARLLQKGVATLLEPLPREVSGLDWAGKPCVLTADDEVGKPISLPACSLTPRSASPRTVLVIGNSYSAAQRAMLDPLVEQGIANVVLTSAWGASPAPGMPNYSHARRVNDDYWGRVVPSLLAELRPGDVLLVLNELYGFAPADPSQPRWSADQLRAGLEPLIRRAAAGGITILHQTTLPFIKDSACSPDLARRQWFHGYEGGACRYGSRADSLARAREADAELRRLAARHANLQLLDLFDLYCPGSECGFSADGVPLYRDDFHPSVEASLRARPALLAAIRRLPYPATSR